MNRKVGIIGFGTLGTVIATILKSSGTPFGVYDILLNDPAHMEAILNRATEHNAPVMDLPQLIRECTYLVSTVTTMVAETVATQCLPYLREGQTFIDCNSTAPDVKINIRRIIQSGQADFVEGVILNAVNPGDSSLDILIGGEKGEAATDFLQAINIRATFYSHEVGKASMFKMLRSIFSKGVEALLLETMVTAKIAGIETSLWKEITAFMDSKSFAVIGETWIKSHAHAYERRYHEMQQVIETMQQIGTTPILSLATLQYFKQSVDADLKSHFYRPPSTAGEVITAIAGYAGAKENER